MEKRIKLLTGVVVASLALNAYSVVRLVNIENSTKRLQNSIYDITRVISQETSYLYRSISEIREDSRWVIAKDVKANLEASSPKEIHIDYQWSLSEVESGAKVALVYRDKSGPGNWKESIAKEVGTNQFSAPMVLSPDKDYEYQLIAEGNMRKVEGVSDLSPDYYKPAPLEQSGSGASSSNGKLHNFEISFAQRQPVLFDFYKVKSVKATIEYNNDRYVTDLKSRQMGDRTEWSLDFPKEILNQSITAVFIETTYGDGSVVKQSYTHEVLEAMASMTR